MKTPYKVFLSFGFPFLWVLTAQATEHRFDARKWAATMPQPSEEHWLKIPWRTNLSQARWEAVQTGKPLLIWVMDGHVLGST